MHSWKRSNPTFPVTITDPELIVMLLRVQCEDDRSRWRITDSFVKTPAQCLATVRKANDRLTILRQGIENH